MKRFACILSLLSAFLVAGATRPCDTSSVMRLVRQSKSELKKNLAAAYTLAHEAFLKAAPCAGSNTYYSAANALALVYYQKDYNDSTIALLLPLTTNTQGIGVNYVAAVHHRLCKAYLNTMALEESMKHGITALKNYELCGDSLNSSNVLTAIAGVYQQQGNFKQAIRHLNEALKLALPLKDKTPLGNLYNTMGILYAEHSHLDSAEKYFLLSTAIREQLNDKTTLVWNYNNLGGLYVMMGQRERASRYLELAMKIFQDDNNVEGQTDVANNLGELYMQLGNNKKALYYYTYSRRFLALANNPDNQENLYNNLRKLYTYKGDAKTALLYADSLIALKDSLYGNRIDKTIAEMQTRFDVEKKDLEIGKQKAELKVKEEQSFVKNIVIVAVTGLLLLVSVIAYLYVKRKQVQQKAEREAELSAQKEIRTKLVLEAEEKERIRIARDLHDGIGQLLSAAKMNLSSLQSKLTLNDTGDETAFKNAIDLVDETVREVRTVSHSMMPNTLLKMGLASAVREFITKLQSTPNLKINLEIVGLSERLEQEKESVLYRAIQEVVANIIKHAGASEISLQLVKHDKELTIMIEDNGVGFDITKIASFEGIGLKNILSRVEFINGAVHFDSAPGKGTRVIMEVPV